MNNDKYKPQKTYLPESKWRKPPVKQIKLDWGYITHIILSFAFAIIGGLYYHFSPDSQYKELILIMGNLLTLWYMFFIAPQFRSNKKKQNGESKPRNQS